MNRSQLEHIIRAAAAILATDQFVIVGSQSILGTYPEATGTFAESVEADLYPMDTPGNAEILSATIGEESHFHSTFGVYADGVSEETSILPAGWRNRLVKVQNENTAGAIGWCLDPTDLAIAKHIAGREKDNLFTAAMGAARHDRRIGIHRTTRNPSTSHPSTGHESFAASRHRLPQPSHAPTPPARPNVPFEATWPIGVGGINQIDRDARFLPHGHQDCPGNASWPPLGRQLVALWLRPRGQHPHAPLGLGIPVSALQFGDGRIGCNPRRPQVGSLGTASRGGSWQHRSTPLRS